MPDNDPLPERPCHCTRMESRSVPMCKDCQGTGLRYPGLSTECLELRNRVAACLDCIAYLRGSKKHCPKHCACNGTGRIEVTGPEAVAAYWEASGTLQRDERRFFRVELHQRVGTPWDDFVYDWAVLTCEQHLEILRSALVAATEASGG